MRKQAVDRRMMERELKTGKVFARRFISACHRIDKKARGSLYEVGPRPVGKTGKVIYMWGVRKPRPSLIHKGGKA